MRFLQFVALLVFLGLASCGGESALDIKTEDLESPCDCSTALNKIADEMLPLIERYSEGEEKEVEEEFTLLEKKANQVWKHCETEFELKGMEECSDFDELEKKLSQIK